MELLSVSFSSLPWMQNKTYSQTFKPTSNFSQIPIKSFTNYPQNHFSLLTRTSSSALKAKTSHLHLPIFFTNHNSTPSPNNSHFFILKNAIFAALCVPFPCLATEISTPTEQISDKIDIESILISIDDFFNRNPFFVSGVTFIWLVVIPLTQEYFKKFKFISAIDAFQKLRNDSNSQLLDIRDKQSLLYLASPNLKILNKRTVHVQFSEGGEEDFVKKVLEKFRDPGNTTICVVDNFDGNSMKAAELLFKNGFKEAYAIKGGLRGKSGWQAIQETLLPPSVHVFRKNDKTSKQLEMKEGTNLLTQQDGHTPSFTRVNRSKEVENGYVNTKGPTPQETLGSGGSLSPYPNYPDMKPPSSPTPSKPQN